MKKIANTIASCGEQNVAATRVQGTYRQKQARGVVQDKRERRNGAIKVQGTFRQKKAREVVASKRYSLNAANVSGPPQHNIHLSTVSSTMNYVTQYLNQ